MQTDAPQHLRKFRIQALFCALAVPLCMLVAHPVVNMSVSDDAPYIRIAQHLADTGHIAYNGWPAPILGWQLYMGAAFIKLFGFSFTHVRMSTIFVGMVMAFFLQRALVAANITERNATIGTLAFVLSPLYLMLSASYMTDIYGLFAIVICIYGCFKALRARTDNAAIGWLCFAVATNAVFGTARQLGWMGIFIELPCTLFLLRARRKVLFAGIAATVLGVAFILACVHWFSQQPYTQSESILLNPFPLWRPGFQLLRVGLGLPFLLLPLMAIFLPEVRRNRPRTVAVIVLLAFGYLFLASFPSHLRGHFLLEPFLGDWVEEHGIYGFISLQGHLPMFLNRSEQVVLTIASIGGLIGLISSLLHRRGKPLAAEQTNEPTAGVTWWQFNVLLVPYLAIYTVLLIPRAVHVILPDRYTLGMLPILVFLLVRYYQDYISPRLPNASYALVAFMALYSIVEMHNWFSLYRARVEIAAEMHAAGFPDTSIDNGWEHNFEVEIQQAGYINDPRIRIPKDAYKDIGPPPPGKCHATWYEHTPHVHPVYGVSFDPDVCYGPAPFAPVHYNRWLTSSPGTLYVVKYTEGTPTPPSPTPVP